MAGFTLTFSGCSTGAIPLGGAPEEAATDSGMDSAGTVDSADDIGGDTSEEEPVVEGWPKSCADIYDPDELPTFELQFSDEQWRGVQSDCSSGAQNYRPVEFTYAGETVSAQARLKGNWSWSCDKLQFVVSFNEDDPAARFHGLRKIMLDAPWYDRTLMHERLAFPLFERLGLPYSCANNARLELNGEYYGLYTNVERIDHEYLERNFEEPEGNLYQGGAELKTNEDVADTSRLVQLQSAGTVDEIAALVNLDEAVAEWAAEAMLPAMDNYWAGVEINYYLYDHPSLGFVYLPYDLDISFGDAAYTSDDLVWPDAVDADPITYEHTGWRKEPLFERVLADPEWCARFVEELVLARAAYSPEDMAAQAETWDAQIGASVAEDARKPFSNSDHAASVASLETFLVARADVVDRWLARGDHCPARW